MGKKRVSTALSVLTVSVVSGLNLKRMYGLSLGTKRTVHDNGVSVKRGLTVQ